MDKVFTTIKPVELNRVTKARRRRLRAIIMRNISICPESIVSHWNSVHQRKSTPMSFVSLMHSMTEVKTPTEGRFDAVFTMYVWRVREVFSDLRGQQGKY